MSLSELPLAIFENQHFSLSSDSVRDVTSAFAVTAFASMVIGALLLPVSLVLWPGTPG